jgi:perosamine synthetase
MITTSNKEFYERMLSYRSLCCRTYDPKGKYLAIDETAHPMGKRYWYLEFDDIGFNYRMTDIQAAVGLVQLRKLDALNARRSEIAKRYAEELSEIPGLDIVCTEPDRKNVFHIFAVLVRPEFPLSKEEFMWELYTKKGIKVWSHYMPIHLTKAYRDLGHQEGECPISERLFDQYVSLPIHPRMTEESIQYVTNSIKELACKVVA